MSRRAANDAGRGRLGFIRHSPTIEVAASAFLRLAAGAEAISFRGFFGTTESHALLQI
jgi:hypothetical protein